MTEKVVIVGCGWLGQQVAPVLASAGLQVFGSRRSIEGAQSLTAPIQGVMLPLADSLLTAEIQDMLTDAWVICTIPPGGRNGAASSDYLTVLQHLASLCRQSTIKGGIHISSTGVYQGLAGEVAESATLKRDHPRVALLAAGEQLLLDSGPWLTLRLAGLMGPGRHPGRFVQGKVLSGEEHPVNMVHSADVARALLAIIAHWPLSQRCYNLSSPHNVTKREFYQAAFAELGMAQAVSFSAEAAEPPRQVLAKALCLETGFAYQFVDARQALQVC